MCNYGNAVLSYGEKRGEIRGEIRGENRLATLLTRLIASGRTADIEKAASDPAEREKLYQEFHIEKEE